MSNDFLRALDEINNEMGISADFIREKIKKAICAVCRNTYGVDDPTVEFKDSGDLVVKIPKKVCEVASDENEISLADAIKIDPSSSIGDYVDVEIDTKQFGRISAQTARNVIRQGIRDGEKEIITEKLKCYEGEVVSAQIVRINRNGSMILKIGNTETILSNKESQFACGKNEGDFLKVFVVRIESDSSSPVPIVSRSSPHLVEKLFEMEVPEISQGIVSIESIAREAGVRTKIAVKSSDPSVEAVGSCIGDRGLRVRPIVEELGGEKIDVIKYSEDPIEYISAAVAPAKVVDINILSTDDKAQNECTVTVPDDQLSLAIGVKGQNVKLASRLTGWKLNLRPESGFYGEE